MIKDLDPNFMELLSAHKKEDQSMPPCKSRAPEKNIANVFCGYWARREGKRREMNKNQASNAPDCSCLILKRHENSENWVEIISSKHLKVKVFNLGLSFLLNFYIREQKAFECCIY